MAILIVDMGSQYTHVIWRTCRDLGREGKMVPKTVARAELDAADAVILSGGPSSVTKDNFHSLPDFIRASKKPILGICLGHQLLAHTLGGVVVKGKNAEYGISKIEVDAPGVLLQGVPSPFNAWVSHFDEVKKMPDGFVSLAHSDTCAHEAMEMPARKLFSVQFHPEVWHTENGEKILENFLKQV
ncbi:MAG: GMP synthase subunit A [Candidatus Micrarchaeota archaeon]|nr:GMP synthase subunit A [Candidatus Micrarchaeota archaeon]